MKKTIVIIAIILTSFGIKAMAEGESISYVKTGKNVFFGHDLKIGLFNTRIISDEGSITKVANRDIVAYKHQSRLFEYLPVVCESKDTICYAMMEYIATRGGLKLYRYCCYDEKDPRYSFFVFKNNKFYLGINEKNAESTLPFFGIKVL